MKNENYIFIGLFLVVGAGAGLLSSIIYEFNIPLSLVVGAMIGIIIGSIIDLLYRKKTQN